LTTLVSAEKGKQLGFGHGIRREMCASVDLHRWPADAADCAFQTEEKMIEIPAKNRKRAAEIDLVADS